MKVDIALNYYGKPYQTLLTIESLMEHSAEHVDRIYLIVEPEQPREERDILELVAKYGDRVVVYRPEHYLFWPGPSPDAVRGDEALRLSVRYQYALETTDKRHLFITHNDVLYTGDLIGELEKAVADGTYAGAGLIGQCWNCPAFTVGLCDSTRHEELRLSYMRAVWLSLRVDSPRTHPRQIDVRRPMPLPECRLNEFACLLDVDTYRRETMPAGAAPPFGSNGGGIDTACGWFRAMVTRGYRFANVNIWDYCEHGAGHPDLSDAARYSAKEAAALELLRVRGAL